MQVIKVLDILKKSSKWIPKDSPLVFVDEQENHFSIVEITIKNPDTDLAYLEIRLTRRP
jgi:hypothetical protein